MQFPVPQFTDVEDKIIGSLSVKQFGILFAAGVLIFLAYSVSKSVLVIIFFSILVGLPAVGVAFGKVNGRPVYNTFGFMLKFYSSPKMLIFHREVSRGAVSSEQKNPGMEIEPEKVEAPVGDTRSRLKEVNRLLEQQAQQQKDLLGK